MPVVLSLVRLKICRYRPWISLARLRIKFACFNIPVVPPCNLFFFVCGNEQSFQDISLPYEGESIYKSYVSANRSSFHHTCRRTREAVSPFSFGSKLEMLMFTFQMRKRANFSCNCHEAHIMSRTRLRKNKSRQGFLFIYLFILSVFFFVMVGLLLKVHSRIRDWHLKH